MSLQCIFFEADMSRSLLLLDDFWLSWITVNWRKEGKPQSTPGGYEVAVKVGIVKKRDELIISE